MTTIKTTIQTKKSKSSTILLKDTITQSSDENLFKDLTQKPEKKYAFIQSIDQGGMKRILRVKDKDTSRDIAMAVLLSHNSSIEDKNRFIKEAKITAMLEHPNIVPVHDIGLDASGSPYFTMKLLKGETLSDIIKKLKAGDKKYLERYNLKSLVWSFRRVCYAVGFAHSKGVIHLDLKPENIQFGKHGEVLLLDWGLAKLIKDDDNDVTILDNHKEINANINVTLDGVAKGTLGYMAPEQAAGENSKKNETTDIYALGAILYTLLTYEKSIIKRSSSKMLNDTILGNIIPPKERAPDKVIPSTIEAVAVKAMALYPEDRYQSVNEFINDINSYLTGFATHAEKASTFKKTGLFFIRHKVISIFSTILLIVLFMFIKYVIEDKMQQKSKWNTIYTQDFKKNKKTQNLIFKDQFLNNITAPWTFSKYGLKMEKYEWLALKDIQQAKNIMLELKVIITKAPDAIEISINSNLEKTDTTWSKPVGYNFQFSGYSGEKNLILKTRLKDNNEIIAIDNFTYEENKIYTIKIIRHEQVLSMYIDGKRVLNSVDSFPITGRNLNKFAIRAYSNFAHLVSLKVSRLSLPEKASPLIAGSALIETNHFDEAINKYLTIAENYNKTEIAQKALLYAFQTAATKIKDKAIRNKYMGKIKLEIETELDSFKYKQEFIELESIVYWNDGNYEKAFDLCQKALETDSSSKVPIQFLYNKKFDLTNIETNRLLVLIASMKNIKQLNLSNLNIARIPLLNKLNIASLNISNNKITNLNFLENSPIHILNCSKNQISDISSLSKMKQLKKLDLSYNKISDFSSLKNLSLQDLNISHTDIASINSLNSSSLKSLNILYCPLLTSLKGIEEINSLEEIKISDNMTEIQLLQFLPNLKYITTPLKGKLTKKEFFLLK